MSEVAKGLFSDGAIVLKGDARRLPLPDESVDLIVTSPPYFALRSYRDGGEHYEGQIGSEATPQEFIDNLIECTAEMVRVLNPEGSIFVDLGDKYAGSGGHNNSGLGSSTLNVSDKRKDAHKATRRQAPDRYNQDSTFYDHSSLSEWSNHPRYKTSVRAKSLMLLPERYRIACVDRLGLIARQVIIWKKPNALPDPARDRCPRRHEDWVHLVKLPRYFSAVDEIRVPHAPKTLTHRGDGQAHGNHDNPDNNFGSDKARAPDPLGAVPGSVWEIASESLNVPAHLEIEHFAAFPQEWPRRLILGWSPPGGTVLDPFGGTGTTAMVARALGRVGISIDLSFDYCRLACWRVFESGHARKAIARTAKERQGELIA